MYKKTKTKFLILPLFYRRKTYWLEKVKITKSFNGHRYLIINVETI